MCCGMYAIFLNNCIMYALCKYCGKDSVASIFSYFRVQLHEDLLSSLLLLLLILRFSRIKWGNFWYCLELLKTKSYIKTIPFHESRGKKYFIFIFLVFIKLCVHWFWDQSMLAHISCLCYLIDLWWPVNFKQLLKWIDRLKTTYFIC